MRTLLLGLGTLLMMVPNGESGAQDGVVRTAEFEFAGLRRAYRLTTPATLPAATSGERALVVMLHGCTQDAADFARGTRIDARAAEAGVMVLMPEQAPAAHPQRCWNWYDPAHARRDSGEAALVAELARAVAAEQGVDPRRIHLAGISAGAAMAVNIAALFPERFASVVAHSGTPAFAASNVGEALVMMRSGTTDPAPLVERAMAAMGDRARAIPLLVIHGAADAVVSLKSGRALEAQWRALHRRLGADGSAVELRVIEGLGHAWSGGDPSGTYTAPGAPDVTADVLRFLLAHPMPSPR